MTVQVADFIAVCKSVLRSVRLTVPVTPSFKVVFQIILILHSEVTQLCPTLCNPWTVAHQAPQPMGLSRHKYWSGLPFPSPGDLPNPGIKPGSPSS